MTKGASDCCVTARVLVFARAPLGPARRQNRLPPEEATQGTHPSHHEPGGISGTAGSSGCGAEVPLASLPRCPGCSIEVALSYRVHAAASEACAMCLEADGCVAPANERAVACLRTSFADKRVVAPRRCAASLPALRTLDRARARRRA